jgi:hypothetical protein
MTNAVRAAGRTFARVSPAHGVETPEALRVDLSCQVHRASIVVHAAELASRLPIDEHRDLRVKLQHGCRDCGRHRSFHSRGDGMGLVCP